MREQLLGRDPEVTYLAVKVVEIDQEKAVHGLQQAVEELSLALHLLERKSQREVFEAHRAARGVLQALHLGRRPEQRALAIRDRQWATPLEKSTSLEAEVRAQVA